MAEMNREAVLSIARLARLRLDAPTTERLRRDLGRILEAFSAIEAIDVDGVEPTEQVLETEGGGREDTVRPCLDREVALREAPDAAEGHFRVPSVIG